jgi:hypothetical protein
LFARIANCNRAVTGTVGKVAPLRAAMTVVRA